MRYRKRPVIIEAVQWDGTDTAMDGITALGGHRDVRANQDGSLSIRTLEGVMRADIGDYVIRGVEGELYPCKPSIFAATYETED